MQVIRSMQRGDIPIIADWMAATPLWQRYNLDSKTIQKMLNDAIEQGTDRLIVVDYLANDDISQSAVGFAWLIMRGAFGRSAYLKFIGVQPDFTGHHIGALLLNAAEQIAHDKGQDLFLMTSDFNTAAQRFYQRQGYSQVGAVPGYVLPDVAELIFWKQVSKPEV